MGWYHISTLYQPGFRVDNFLQFEVGECVTADNENNVVRIGEFYQPDRQTDSTVYKNPDEMSLLHVLSAIVLSAMDVL